MFGLFRKKEKNTLDEVERMANDLGFTVTKAGKVLCFMSLKSDYSSSETLSNLLVIHIAKQISERPLGEIVTESMMHTLNNVVAYINDRYNRRYIKKDLYENDFKAIITMMGLDSNGFAIADKIVEQNNPVSQSTLLSPI